VLRSGFQLVGTRKLFYLTRKTGELFYHAVLAKNTPYNTVNSLNAYSH